MLSKPAFYAGVYLCLALPAWADPPSGDGRDSPPAVTKHSLSEFVQRVWEQSPAVQRAQAALEAAQANADAADKPLHNPVLELDAETSGVDTTTLGINQTIDWSNKRKALILIAGQELNVARARLLQTRQAIALEVLRSLIHYSVAREIQNLAEQRSRLMKRFLDTVQSRRAVGDVAALDVTLAQVAYTEAQLIKAASASELVVTEAALRAVAGLNTNSWPRLPKSFTPLPEQDAGSLADTLPSLMVLHSRAEAARARTGLTRKLGKADPVVGFRAGQEEKDRLMGLTIAIPLFVRNNYEAKVREASHQAAAKEQEYRDALRRARAALKGARGRLENTRKAWREWSAAGQQALARQRQLLERMWHSGELSATEYLIQAKQNTDTRVAATRLWGEAWQAAIAWLEASGRVDTWLGLGNSRPETDSGETK